jgi:hypothetical protein
MTEQLPQVSIDPIILKGGLDQITPSLLLPNGYARQSLNFECSVTGGYKRIAGYERFDGSPSPADSADSGLHRYLTVASYTNVPVVGNTLTASGGATGVISYIDGLTIVITKSTGTWAVSETVAVGATAIGTLTDVTGGPATPLIDAIIKNAVADIYRADIEAVPGSGPVRGVVEFNDIVYGFRDNVDSTALGIYKSSSSGWVNVPLYKTVSFTAGGATVPAEGATLTQGGVTAVIKRVVRTSGDWLASDAAGQFVITTLAGGNFARAAATIGGINVTLSGVQTAQELLPGGKFEFTADVNFAGSAATKRLYGCDGVNQCFEFDGEVLVLISTAAIPDTPTHIAYHKGYLFVSIGSSVMFSTPGLPYDFTALGGAGEIATGDLVTGIISMPGNENSSAIAIFNRSNTSILYQRALYDGSFSNWTLVPYNNGCGASPFSAADMAQTYVFDDRGVNSVTAAKEYGNFNQAALTTQIQPFIDEHASKLSYATLCRRKSQYRVFFSDGWALFITIINNKLLGCMPVLFPNPIFCCYEGKKNDGTDVIYFGSTNGMVYQMEKGTSFDGADIEYNLTLNYANAKSPRTLKRFRKAALEVSSDYSAIAVFDFAYILGYDSHEYNQPGNTPYSQYTGQVRWDSIVWDNFFWDANRYEPIEAEMEGTAENVAIFINGTADYVPEFTINSLLIHYSPRRMIR